MTFSKSFSISKEDYLTFSKFACKRLRKPQSQFFPAIKNLILWFVIAFVFMFIFKSFNTEKVIIDWVSVCIGAIPFVIFLTVFIFENIKLQKLFVPRENGLLLSENKLEINESGIAVSNRNAKAHYAWDSVEEILENNGSYYFFLDTLYAIIIPKKALTSQEDLDNLQGCIEKYV